MGPSHPFCCPFGPVFSVGVGGQEPLSLRQGQKFFIGPAVLNLPEGIAVFPQQYRQVTGLIQSEVPAQHRHRSRPDGPGLQGFIHAVSGFLIRSQAVFPHDGIHIAPGKEDVRELRLQRAVDMFQVAAQKVVKADGV